MSKDGGPAFPVPDNVATSTTDGEHGVVSGMSLRDWFAGMALSSATDKEFASMAYNAVADWCYCVADAMIEARNKGGVMESSEVKMSEPERRIIEVLINGRVVRTMGCTFAYQVDGEISYLSRIQFDEPVNVLEGEEFSYRFVKGGKEVKDES